jgi:hypothetical protein
MENRPEDVPAMKRSIHVQGNTFAKPRTALFEPPARPTRHHSEATVQAARRAFVAYLAADEVEVDLDEDGDEFEVNVPRMAPLPSGIARAVLVLGEHANPRSPEKAREFAWRFAAIALQNFDEDEDDEEGDEDDDQEEGGL